jgi:hypothetical protein
MIVGCWTGFPKTKSDPGVGNLMRRLDLSEHGAASFVPICNAPLISCSGVMSPKEIAHEYRDGRKDQELGGARRSALVLNIIQGKTTVSKSCRQFDLPPSEIESCIDHAKAGMKNGLKAKPEDMREQYESQPKALQ